MKKERRYDLDWLRVLVFALLIIYHIGMFFVPWGWHIKNNELYTFLEWPMIFVSNWRLPILFVISGMGTRYALAHRTGSLYIKERLTRLGIPLLFGILFIIPPQVYCERVATGYFDGSYFQFLASASYMGIYPEGNISWHHLWFLPYLLLFSIAFAPLFLRIRNDNSFLMRFFSPLVNMAAGLLIFAIPLFVPESLLEPYFPETHALLGDWYALVFYGLFFLFGYIMISIKDIFWPAVESHRRFYFITAVVTFVLFYMIRLTEDTTAVHFAEAAIKVTCIWSWILTFFGYASIYLNRPSKLIRYCNRAVYPFYIFHQTITVVIGYFLMNLDWGFGPKFIVLTVGTFGISWLLYEIVNRIPILYPLFGLK